VENRKDDFMKVIKILNMVFFAIMAVCSLVFPILFLGQKHKQHNEVMDWLRKKNENE